MICILSFTICPAHRRMSSRISSHTNPPSLCSIARASRHLHICALQKPRRSPIPGIPFQCPLLSEVRARGCRDGSRTSERGHSAAYLKFLPCSLRVRPGTSNRKAALGYKLSSALCFPKFVQEGAGMVHGLRKEGTSDNGPSAFGIKSCVVDDGLARPDADHGRCRPRSHA
jgi:hypothetical protein